MSDSQSNKAFSMIADIDGDFMNLIDVETPGELPILPVRNLVLFPGVVSPILIGRESSMRLVRKVEKTGAIIGIVCQNDPDVEEPGLEDLFTYGVFAKVVKQLTLPNGAVTAIIQGLGRMRLLEIVGETPYLMGRVERAPELMPDKRDKEWKTAIEDLRHQVEEYISITDEIPDEANFAIRNISNDVMALNFVCSNMPFTTKEKNRLISVDTM